LFSAKSIKIENISDADYWFFYEILGAEMFLKTLEYLTNDNDIQTNASLLDDLKLFSFSVETKDNVQS
jgi:hypothetical protein